MDALVRTPLCPAEIRARIEKALEIDGTHAWGDLVARFHDGRSQVFWNDHGAWVTDIIVYPRKRVLHVWIVAGELPEVMKVQTQVEAFARLEKCDYITAVARFGWKHVARQHGWQEHAMLIRHPVDPDRRTH